MEELSKVLSKEQNEIMSKLDKALQGFKGKQVIIDTNEDIMTDQVYENLDYKFFQDCEKEVLLDFQDENNEATPTICIKLDDIYHITIDENVDVHYVQSIKIELKNKFIMKLAINSYRR